MWHGSPSNTALGPQPGAASPSHLESRAGVRVGTQGQQSPYQGRCEAMRTQELPPQAHEWSRSKKIKTQIPQTLTSL